MTYEQHWKKVTPIDSSENEYDSVNPLPVGTNNPISPEKFIYKFLTLSSGPTGTSTVDMDPVSATGSQSFFDYEVPAGETFKFSRINMSMVDGSINPGDFGGINGGLTNGCELRILDTDNSLILDFTDGQNIKTNADFVPLSGSDVPITALAGDDLIPIRFSVFKAGGSMKLTAGQKVRLTVQDDLSALTKFRAMVQGVLA